MDSVYVNRLLQALKNPDETVRNRATAEFWHLWFHQKGPQGAERLLESQTLLEKNDAEAAQTILDALIKEEPDFAEAWNRRAVFYYLRQQYPEAIRDCEQTLELVPYHFGALHGMGLCYASLGNYREAIQYFRHALEIQPFSLINQRLILECTAQLT